jgi:hypothetical protein
VKFDVPFSGNTSLPEVWLLNARRAADPRLLRRLLVGRRHDTNRSEALLLKGGTVRLTEAKWERSAREGSLQ